MKQVKFLCVEVRGKTLGEQEKVSKEVAALLDEGWKIAGYSFSHWHGDEHILLTRNVKRPKGDKSN